MTPTTSKPSSETFIANAATKLSFEASILTEQEIMALLTVTSKHVETMVDFARAIEKSTAIKIAESFERDGVEWVGRAIRHRTQK